MKRRGNGTWQNVCKIVIVRLQHFVATTERDKVFNYKRGRHIFYGH